jgi:hypothetical protein
VFANIPDFSALWCARHTKQNLAKKYISEFSTAFFSFFYFNFQIVRINVFCPSEYRFTGCRDRGSLSAHFPNEHLQECACHASIVTTRQPHSGSFVSSLASLSFLKFVCRFQTSTNPRMRFWPNSGCDSQNVYRRENISTSPSLNNFGLPENYENWGGGAFRSVYGWDAMLKSWRSRVLVPMMSLNFSMYLIHSAALWPWNLLSH